MPRSNLNSSHSRTRRNRRIRAAIALAVTIAALAGLRIVGVRVWVLTETDRQRLAEMQEAPAQPAHLDAITDDRHYPIDMRPFADLVDSGGFAQPAFDADGIVQVPYGRVDPSTDTTPLVHNPVTAAQYALGCYERYIHGDPTQLDGFMRHAEWLRKTMGPDGRLEYRFDVASRQLTAPWISAMAQGEAISVFVRAAATTGDDSWLNAARLAYGPLTIPVTDGGAIATDGSELWLEEYPKDPPSHVFNGHVFALFGVRDLARATDDPAIDKAWRAAAITLADHLKDYEYDGWLRYDLTPGTLARRQYYRLQVDQTRILAEMTGDVRFKEAIDRWDGPLEHPGNWVARRFVTRGVEALRRRLPW